MVVTDNPTSTTSTTTSNTSSQSTNVNLVQTSKTNRWKNHNQRKRNAPVEQGEANVKEPNPSNNNRGKKKLKFPCLACKEDHFTKDCPHLADVKKLLEQSKNPTPVVLTNPFPTQHQQMVAQVLAQPPTNQSVAAPSRASSSSVNILRADSIDLTTRAKNYNKQPEGEPSAQVNSPSIPQSNGSLTFEKPTFEAPSYPSKGTLWRTHNLNAWASQHYNIVEDLPQAPCAM